MCLAGCGRGMLMGHSRDQSKYGRGHKYGEEKGPPRPAKTQGTPKKKQPRPEE